MAIVVRSILASVLVAAAVAKLASPRAGAAAFATFGVRQRAARWTLFAVVAAVELLLAAGVALGSTAAAYAAAALLTAFALALAVALRRGRAGAPCACFGARSRVTRTAVLRNLALAGGFAVLPLLPAETMSADAWLVVGLGASLAGVIAIGVVVLALAREVAALRLELAPQGALELADEGPAVGQPARLIDRFAFGPRTRLALAVFTSPGCRLCRRLEPAIASAARDPRVSLRVFDEEQDEDAWEALGIPGSPFAVALDRDGIVRAKGTFNTPAQLETILRAAERRSRELAAA